MKTPRLLLLSIIALFATLAPRPAEARVEVSFDFFYDSLAPHGEWLEVADYGYCWRPTAVDEDWAPYADGYWAFTDAGWTWVSYEEFGGIVYHYGRWVRVEDEGWCWTPDYEWGPAWVSWRQNDDYVGWAPLPPEARWQPAIGLSTWVDREYDIGPAHYSFCRVRDFGAPVLRPVIISRVENITIIRRTVNITNITYNTTYADTPIIYNGGPTYAVINQRSTRRVPALKLVLNADFQSNDRRQGDRRDGDRSERRRDFNAQAVGNQLVVVAPFVKPAESGFLKTKSKKVVAADKVQRGWSGVKNEDARRELRQEMQRQTKGTPETAPARPVAAAELKALPAKADPQAPSPVVGAKDRRDRSDKADKKEPATATAEQPAGVPVPVAPQEPVVSEPARGKGKTATSKESPKPIAETDQKPPREKGPTTTPPEPTATTEVPPSETPGKMRGDRKKIERTAETATPTEATRAMRKQGEVANEQRRAQEQDAEREKMRGAKERAVREQAEAAQQLSEKQREAAARRQRRPEPPADRPARPDGLEKAARQQAEAAAQQKRMEAQQGAAQEAARGQAAERGKQQEMEGRRRQQSEQQAAEQNQRRQAMEQQRAAGEAAAQARRAQEGQREQMRQQTEAPRPKREAPRVEPPRAPQAAPPPAGAPQVVPPVAPEEQRRGKKKDKDN